MIAMIRGTLVEKSEGEAVVLTGSGMGLRLLCSMNTLSALPAAGQECTLHTHMNVREDAMELFGFMKKEERDMFRRLISVSGIGPKSALFVLGSMPLTDLRLAILTGISLELKDKLTKDALSSGVSMDEISYMDTGEAPATDALGEAMQALKALGYSPQEAAAALKGVKGKADTSDELIKLALRHMAQQG